MLQRRFIILSQDADKIEEYDIVTMVLKDLVEYLAIITGYGKNVTMVRAQERLQGQGEASGVLPKEEIDRHRRFQHERRAARERGENDPIFRGPGLQKLPEPSEKEKQLERAKEDLSLLVGELRGLDWSEDQIVARVEEEIKVRFPDVEGLMIGDASS